MRPELRSHKDAAEMRRRFRVEHALRSIEDALKLLEPKPVEGIETSALERVRDDLSTVLRLVKATGS